METKPILEKLKLSEGLIIHMALCHFKEEMREFMKVEHLRDWAKEEMDKIDRIIRKVPYNCV